MREREEYRELFEGRDRDGLSLHGPGVRFVPPSCETGRRKGLKPSDRRHADSRCERCGSARAGLNASSIDNPFCAWSEHMFLKMVEE